MSREIIKTIVSKLSAFVSRFWRRASRSREVKNAPTLPAEQPQTEEDHAADPTSSPAVEPTESIKPVACFKTEWRENLVDTLANMDAAFEAVKIEWGGSHISTLSKTNSEGLKKIGPMLIRSWRKELNEERETVPPDVAWPAVMFLAVLDGDKSDDDFLEPDFFYAIRRKKTPWNITKTKGSVYEVGFAYREKTTKKLWWVGAFVGIQRDGSILTTSMLCNVTRRVTGGSYTSRTWRTSSWQDGKEAGEAVKHCVAAAFRVYHARRNDWVVSVDKGGQRVRFSVAPENTKHYFADRGLRSDDGARKKIIHVCRAHHRVVNGKFQIVREHIRGERAFWWKGMRCYVTSPKYHAFTIGGFDLAAEDIGEHEHPAGMIGLGEVAATLYRHEDAGAKRSLDAVHGIQAAIRQAIDEAEGRS